MTMRSVRMVFQVTAGVIPGQPEKELTKQFTIFSDYWYSMTPGEQIEHVKAVAKEAYEYAASLTNPAVLNWVNTEWLYF